MLNVASRYLLIRLILISWLVQIVVCHGLWTTQNETFIFSVPLLEGMETTRIILAGATIVILLFAIWKPNKYIIATLLFCWLMLTPFNLNVWQAWFWLFYLLTFTYFVMPTLFRHAIWVFLAGMYFWSGLYKLNSFYLSDWEWNLSLYNERVANQMLQVMALVPYLEILMAVLLWIPMIRRQLHLIAIFFHLGVALVLSPLVLDMNHVVIPWNIMLAVINYQLWRNTSNARVFHLKPMVPGFMFSWVFPTATLLFGSWHAQAFNLYSGHMPYIDVTIDGKTSSIFALHVLHTGVPCLPDESAQLNTFEKLCKNGDVEHAVLTLRTWKKEEIIPLQCLQTR